MLITAGSDIHDNPEILSSVEFPNDRSVLLIGGDVCKLSGQLRQGLSKKDLLEIQIPQLEKFNGVIVELQRTHPGLHVFFTPGNHDPENEDLLRSHLSGMDVLIDECVELSIDGKVFYLWGTPWQSLDPCGERLEEFSFQRLDDHVKRYLESIPDWVNALLTHSPAATILDRITIESKDYGGSPALVQRINELEELCLHVFGHCHPDYGTKEVFRYPKKGALPPYLAVNASLQKVDGSSWNPPIQVNVEWSDEKERWCAQVVS